MSRMHVPVLRIVPIGMVAGMVAGWPPYAGVGTAPAVGGGGGGGTASGCWAARAGSLLSVMPGG